MSEPIAVIHSGPGILLDAHSELCPESIEDCYGKGCATMEWLGRVYDAGQSAERSAVVEWLREQYEIECTYCEDCSCDTHAATQIENGAHGNG